MALIIRKSKSMARLVRRHWVPKGTTGNTHGYAAEVSLGSMPLTARSWPQGFEQDFPKGEPALSEDELCLVQREVFEAAMAREMALKTEEAARAADPGWRIAEALRLLRQAAPLCEQRALEKEMRGDLMELVALLGSIAPMSEPSTDPIELAIHSVKAAATLVDAGLYGTSASDVVKKDAPAAILWKRLRDSVTEDDEISLRAALQRAGWVTKRSAMGCAAADSSA